MPSPFGVPVQGAGPPTAGVIQSGQEYYDLQGFNLWRPTNNPNIYHLITGDSSSKRIFATLSNGYVYINSNGTLAPDTSNNNNIVVDPVTTQSIVDPVTMQYLVTA